MSDDQARARELAERIAIGNRRHKRKGGWHVAYELTADERDWLIALLRRLAAARDVSAERELLERIWDVLDALAAAPATDRETLVCRRGHVRAAHAKSVDGLSCLERGCNCDAFVSENPLRAYVAHKRDCEAHDTNVCTCGLDAVLASGRAGEAGR